MTKIARSNFCEKIDLEFVFRSIVRADPFAVRRRGAEQRFLLIVRAQLTLESFEPSEIFSLGAGAPLDTGGGAHTTPRGSRIGNSACRRVSRWPMTTGNRSSRFDRILLQVEVAAPGRSEPAARIDNALDGIVSSVIATFSMRMSEP